MTPRTLYDPNEFPRELWRYRQFINWLYVPDPKGGKDKKKPVNPKTLGGASYKWPNTWSDIRVAVRTYQEHTHLNGAGFMLTENDPYTQVDVDNCLIDDQPSPLAQQVASILRTYCEVSPSGRGLRFLIRCWPLPTNHAKPNHIELYSREKFCTLTGKVWRESLPIAQVNNVEALLQPFLGERRKDPLVFLEGTTTTPDPDDDALWQQIFNCNQLAYRLFHNELAGNVRGQAKDGGPDKSRAVILLLNSLALWTKGDAARMKRMIEQTHLDKTRWEDKRGGATWLDYQIGDAVAYMGGARR